MRGDSRWDLYAKTLALCGLGVLAGAGAVVDYWPVGIKFPQIAVTFEQPVLELPGPLDLPEHVPMFAVVESPVRPAPRVASRMAAAPAADVAPAFYESFPTMSTLAELGHPVELHQPLTPPVLQLAFHDTSSLGATTAPLEAPATAMLADAGGYAPPIDGERDGFLTTAFRVTGTSIVRTGVKTGTSLVDAARVVGSVVRRAWPN